VTYSMSGTARNGVDYVALPGVVTIPAGQPEAMITIIPLDGPTNSAVATVILSLSPSTSSPPAYAPGFPGRAEIIIIDNGLAHPVLPGAVLGDHSFLFSAAGPDGAWFRVDCTTNCIHWSPICTNQVINGSIDFADPDSANVPLRLYRIVPLSGPPSN